jgi:D-alanyl-D-alanine carboxypeptidase
MRRKRFTAVIVLALVFGRTAAADDPGKVRRVATHPEVTAALTVLDSWIEATARQREQPGLSVGVVYDQELIWSKGYGFADAVRKVPATPSTLYRIASISKLFTSTAIMQLRDAGKLRLDDPVKQHLPWFAIRPASPEAQPVTIRHLITHTSGLPREADGVNWSDLTFPDRDAMVKRLGGQEPVFPPETEWKYSNLALTLAGEIVAAASNVPWADYVERHILQPLQMASSRPLPKADTPGLAIGYGRRVPGRPREVEPFVDIGAENPAGSLASNVEDLAKFVSLQLREDGVGGTRILKGSTIREMHRVQWLRSNWQSGWALGFSIRRVGDQVRIGHGGSLPGHRTQVEIAPADKLGIIVLTNANDGEPMRYLNQAFTILTGAIRKAAGPTTPQMTARPEWERYVGRYAWKHEEMHILLLNGTLTMITPDAENPWEGRMILEPVGEHKFRLKPADVSFGAIGEVVTFEVNGSGQVTKVRTPNFYWLPKSEGTASALK